MESFFENRNCSITWVAPKYFYGGFRMNGTQDPVRDYSDISGIGVTVGFEATALYCVLLAILHYLTSDLDGNPFDQMALQILRFPPRFSAYKNRLRVSFEKAAKDLSDAQSLIGIALMLSGYFALFTDALSMYHWTYIFSLGTLSYCSTLSATVVIRGHLLKHYWRRIWRLSSMAILFLLLIISYIPMGFQNILVSPEPQWTYAVCGFYWQRITSFLEHGRDLHAVPYYHLLELAAPQILLISSFLARIAKLSKNCQKLVIRIRKFFDSLYVRLLGRVISTQSRINKLWLQHYHIYGLILPLLAVRLTASIYIDLITSSLFEVICLVIPTLWIPINLYALHRSAGADDIDRQWNYGQVLPLFLLIVPLFASIGSFISEFHTSELIENAPSMDANNVSSGSLNPDQASPTATSEAFDDTMQTLELPIGIDSIRTPRLVIPRSLCILQVLWMWFILQLGQVLTIGFNSIFYVLYAYGFMALVNPFFSTYFMVLFGLDLDAFILIGSGRPERRIWAFVQLLTGSLISAFYFLLLPIWYTTTICMPRPTSCGFLGQFVGCSLFTIIVFIIFQIFSVGASFTSARATEGRQGLQLDGLHNENV